MSERRKIRVLKPLEGVYAKYQPEVGKVYEADYCEPKRTEKKRIRGEFCVVDVLDKRIVMRHGEFELVGG